MYNVHVTNPFLLLPKLQVVIINPVPRNSAANNNFNGSSKIYILDSDLVWQVQLILIKGWIFVNFMWVKF